MSSRRAFIHRASALGLLLLAAHQRALAVSLSQLSNADAASGVKAALARGAEVAVDMLGRTDGWLTMRLTHLEKVIGKRDWLAGSFSIADILMADLLRLVDRFDGLKDFPTTKAYVARATARPAFIKARDEQIARFKAADAAA